MLNVLLFYYICYDCICSGVGSKWRVYMCVSGGWGLGLLEILSKKENDYDDSYF